VNTSLTLRSVVVISDRVPTDRTCAPARVDHRLHQAELARRDRETLCDPLQHFHVPDRTACSLDPRHVRLVASKQDGELGLRQPVRRPVGAQHLRHVDDVAERLRLVGHPEPVRLGGGRHLLRPPLGTGTMRPHLGTLGTLVARTLARCAHRS
jgi:hypothetical protein